MTKQMKISIIGCVMALLFVGCDKTLPPTPESEFVHFISVDNSMQYTAEEFAQKTVGSYSLSLHTSAPDVHVDVIRYRTTDPTGQTVTASGIVAYPASGASGDVLLAEHYTIAANHEAPSEVMCVAESAFALFRYIVITPDYLGFGASKELPQPYLHVQSTARASLDFLFAVREYMKTKDYPMKESLYIAGYSQGGAAALAVQKIAEKEHAGDVHIIKVIAGGGPYDLASIFHESRETGKMSRPSMFAMTIVGLDYGDNLHLDYTKVFTGELLSNYNDWINSKNYNVDEIDSHIGPGSIARFLHPDFFSPVESTNSEFLKLYESAVRNSLIDWTPRSPIVLIHGVKDQLVPYSCAQNAYDSFKKRGCDVTLVPFDSDHTGSATGYVLCLLSNII